MHYLIEVSLLHAQNLEMYMEIAYNKILCVLGGDGYQQNRNAEMFMLWTSYITRRYW